MELPGELRLALDAVCAEYTPRVLATAASQLSARYRGVAEPAASRDSATATRKGAAEAGHAMTPLTVAAYAATRLPATYAALAAVLIQARVRSETWRPQTLLDVGAGPGVALWAAQMLWPNLAQATLLERDARMIALGQRLASEATSPVIRQARWERTDITDAWESGHQSFDLVTASYVLGELPAPERETLVARLWRVTVSMLALVAPGTPVGFAHIHAAREQLLELGATLVAPCPHDGACPMLPLGEGEVAPGQPVGDWCHFSQRLARSRLHRQLKGGELAYEDEKFSYVIAARPGSEAAPATSIGGRIVRHPQMRPGVVTLEVCARDGALTRRVVSRRDGAAYRQARDLRWGDALRS